MAGPATAADTSGPFDRNGLAGRIRPFAIVGTVGVVTVAITPLPNEGATLAIGAILSGLAIGTAVLVPWRRLPRWADLLPPLSFVLAVAVMRQAAGGQASGLVSMFALPLVWVAMYGSRRQVLVVLSASALALILPIVLIGDPDYPVTEWRRVVVNTSIGALISLTVHGLVTRTRAQAETETVRAAALAEKEERLRAVHETAHDAIVTLKPDGTIFDVNPAALELFRASDRGQLLGLDLIATLAVDSEREFLRVGMARLTVRQDETTSRRFHTELVRLDGDVFPAEVSVGVVVEAGQYLVHAFARDVSERVRAEAAAKRHREDLDALLEVGRDLASPAASPALRSKICEATLSMAGGAMALLLEPEGDDLLVTASAGRHAPVDRVPRGDRSTAAAAVFQSGVPLFAGHLAEDSRVSDALAAKAHVAAGYWLPIQISGEVGGVLVVFWDEAIGSLDPRVESVLNLLASQAAAALEMARLVGRLEGLARTDGLTGIANRRTFDETIAAELERAARSSQPLSLIMVDLDHFKRFNDARGHQAGDRLLVEAAAAWQRELRPADVLARYGGEEFAVILPDCPAEAALRVAARLRGDVPGGQTISAGVATWTPGESSAQLVARADGALYRAKAEGRDRAVAA